MTNLKKGDLLIFPTDTVYGLGCKLYDLKGLEKIYIVKKRNIGKQIPVLVPNLDKIDLLCKFTKRDKLIMEHFWPGALTLILKSSDIFFEKTNQATIAVRIPKNKLALSLLNNYGPLWVTSCNISNDPPLNDKKEILKTFKNSVKHIYFKENAIDKKKSSTILDLTGNEIKVIREGEITLEDVLNYLSKGEK